MTSENRNGTIFVIKKEEETGTHFDKDVADAFIDSRPQIEQFIEEISQS